MRESYPIKIGRQEKCTLLTNIPITMYEGVGKVPVYKYNTPSDEVIFYRPNPFTTLATIL